MAPPGRRRRRGAASSRSEGRTSWHAIGAMVSAVFTQDLTQESRVAPGSLWADTDTLHAFRNGLLLPIHDWERPSILFELRSREDGALVETIEHPPTPGRVRIGVTAVIPSSTGVACLAFEEHRDDRTMVLVTLTTDGIVRIRDLGDELHRQREDRRYARLLELAPGQLVVTGNRGRAEPEDRNTWKLDGGFPPLPGCECWTEQGLEWRLDEGALATAGPSLITLEGVPLCEGAILHARAADSRELWRRPFGGCALLAADAAQVVAVDVSLRRAEALRDPSMRANARRPRRVLDSPAFIFALDARTGQERWRQEIDGDVVAWASFEDASWAIIAHGSGRGRWVRISAAGEMTLLGEVQGAPFHHPPHRPKWPYWISTSPGPILWLQNHKVDGKWRAHVSRVRDPPGLQPLGWLDHPVEKVSTTLCIDDHLYTRWGNRLRGYRLS